MITSKAVYVYVKLSANLKPVLAGRLNFFDERVEFRYAPDWLNSPLQFAFHPDLLPLGQSLYSSRGLDGCLSVFRDAGPGVWGKEVIKRRYQKVDPADYLVLSNNMLRIGVFRYAESRDELFNNPQSDPLGDIEEVYAAVKAIERGEPLTDRQSLMLEQGSGMDGMRPKSFVEIDGESWILKFPSKGDNENKAVSELIGMRLSRACGIETPEVKLVQLSDTRNAIAVKRFDTNGSSIFPLMSVLRVLWDLLMANRARKTTGYFHRRLFVCQRILNRIVSPFSEGWR